MEEIDYTEKIATFNLLVGNNNEEIALNYLTLTNWDETKAAMLYNQENKGPEAKLNPTINFPAYQYVPTNNQKKKNNENTNNIKKKPIASPNINKKNNNNLNNISNNNNFYASKTYIQPKITYNSIQNNMKEINKYAQCEIFKKKFADNFKIFKTDNRGYSQGFNKICPKCMKLYDDFINNLKNNVGIVIIYNKKTYNESINIFKSIVNSEVTKDLLSYQTTIISLISGSLEADKIIKELAIKIFPTILICLYKNDTHIALIGSVTNILKNLKLLNEKLIEAHELLNGGSNASSLNKIIPPIDKIDISPTTNVINNKNNININNNINNNSINIINDNNNNINNKQNILNDINNFLPDDINDINRDSYSYMTDGEILARQEREMKNLERMEEKKRLDEERKEKEKKEEEEKKKEEELIEKIKVDSILNILPEEPSDDNPDKCVILFRFPDGEKVVQRKFLKTDNVSILYLYIKSLGREIYNENEEKHFSLIQSFPFKNFDEVQNRSLEQEGLFPNAVLQIKAIE